MSAEEALDRYLNGEINAFASIVKQFERSLLNFASRLVNDTALAQDIVQETFVRLVREAGNLRQVQSLENWLFRVCRNLSVDALKKETRMRRRESAAAVPEQLSPEECPAESEESHQLISRLMAELPPNEREVVHLKVVGGRSYKQISEITGHSSGHVGYLIHHGLKRLAKSCHAAGLIESMPGAGERS